MADSIRRRAKHMACLPLVLLLAPMIFQIMTVSAQVASSSARMCDDRKPDAVRMQLRWLKNGQFAGYYAAQAAGYYAEECLDVEMRQRRGGDTAEESVLKGDAHFATPWAMSDVILRDANQTSYRTLAQTFNRPGSTMLVRNLYVPNNVSSLKDIAAEARRLGRPIKIGVNDDMFAFWARLSELGVRTCGAWSAPGKTGPECVPGDEVELLERDLNGLRNMKLPQDHPGFIDIYSGHINDLSNILQAVAADGELVGSTDRVNFVEVGGLELLEDGVCVSQDWLSQPGSEDIARRFLRASMKGWILCRDNPRTCAEIIEAQDMALQRDTLFQIVEINKLIWPAQLGIGGLDTFQFQRQYDFLAEMGVSSRSYDASTNVVPNIIRGVIANLAAEGYDVYGFRYATEANQKTLEYCVDEQTGQPVLCAMRCNPGTEPPAGGQVYHRHNCLPCAPGTASPGGTEPCLPCLEGHDAPSAGMAHCIAPGSQVLSVGLPVAASLVVLLIALGIFFFLRSRKLKKELEAMRNANSNHDAMDMDSPFVKVLGFLQELGQGKHGHVLQPWKKDSLERKAREMRTMLLHSKDIAAPDIQALMSGHYSEEMVRFVLEQTMDESEIPEPGSRRGSGKFLQFDPSVRPRSNSFDRSNLGDQLQEQLRSVGQAFTVDAFYLHSLCPTGLLAIVAIRFCEDWGLRRQLGLSMTRLATFANIIEKGHQDNPYHCLAHTVDVTMRLGAILNKSGIARHMSHPANRNTGPLTLLGALISAMVHDYQHLGVSNNFLVSTDQELSIRFNHQSCLENHALFEALDLLRHPETSFIDHFSKSQQLQLRTLIIKMVLATDMSHHFSLLTTVQTKVLDNFDNSTAPEERLELLNSEQCHILMQLCLKCADLGHCTLPIKLHLRWTEALQEELWALGDQEKNLAMSISPLADRDKPGVLWGANQVGFFQALVCPMYNMLVAVAPECHELHDGVNENLAFWKNHPEAPPDELMAELKRGESTDSLPDMPSQSGQADVAVVITPECPRSPQSSAGPYIKNSSSRDPYANLNRHRLSRGSGSSHLAGGGA